jgi:hypothetical protein
LHSDYLEGSTSILVIFIRVWLAVALPNKLPRPRGTHGRTAERGLDSRKETLPPCNLPGGICRAAPWLFPGYRGQHMSARQLHRLEPDAILRPVRRVPFGCSDIRPNISASYLRTTGNRLLLRLPIFLGRRGRRMGPRGACVCRCLIAQPGLIKP